MKLAIMQPYLFPYFGYYQLINSVDKFVVYDDVNFIKQGWINRNSILINGKPFLFTVPLKNQSSFLKINETLINENLFGSWAKKFLRSIEQNYRNAPFYNDVFPIITSIIEAKDLYISSLAVGSLKKVSDYIGITTVFEDSSSGYNNSHLSSQERVLDICKQENATHYINPIGGLDLYSKDDFYAKGIRLNFVQSNPVIYKQFNHPFVSHLSIIDMLMFNDKAEIKKYINNYELV